MNKMPYNLKYYTAVLLCCLLSIRGWGQVNLVHNPSFEDIDMCAMGFNQISNAYYWNSLDSLFQYPMTNGIPDLINSCSNGSTLTTSTPVNHWFFSYPHSGNNMVQVNMYIQPLAIDPIIRRDYLQGRLKRPLTAGKSYCVTYYTKQEHGSYYSVKAGGVYFDNGTIDTTHYPGLPQTMYVPQISPTIIISDTTNWIKIEASFIASGNESFFTVGNFSDNLHTDTTHLLRDTSTIFKLTPNLFDDFSVIESNTLAHAGNDTTIHKGDSILIGEIAVPYTWYKRTSAGLTLIDSVSGGIWMKPDSTTTYVVKLTLCGVETWDSIKVTVLPVGINNLNANGSVLLYPNPINNELNISNAPMGTSIQVYDVVGRLVYSDILNAKQESINTSAWERGAYFVELLLPDGSREVRKVLK